MTLAKMIYEVLQVIARAIWLSGRRESWNLGSHVQGGSVLCTAKQGERLTSYAMGKDLYRSRTSKDLRSLQQNSDEDDV